MAEPVYNSVFDKRDVADIALVNVIVEAEKSAQARLSEDCVCRLENDAIAGDIAA
jgi:hypothetical protein